MNIDISIEILFLKVVGPACITYQGCADKLSLDRSVDLCYQII